MEKRWERCEGGEGGPPLMLDAGAQPSAVTGVISEQDKLGPAEGSALEPFFTLLFFNGFTEA